jgi:hypothetical protein
MHPKGKTAQEFLKQLEEATSGLLFPSETDAPLTPYAWPGDAEPTPEALLQAAGKPAETKVETTTVDDFFSGVVEPVEGGIEESEASRYRAVVALLNELSELRVYRVGGPDFAVTILGRHASGAWLGLQTHVVET